MSDETIFAAALAISSTSKRSKYLDEACDGNATLRRDVEALLIAHGQANPLDRADHRGPPLAATCLPDSSITGTIIAGRYKLLEQIGDGGMGTVWMAEQREPVKRLVAVKLIKPGMDSKAVLARFEAERQALAIMDHPNIAKVLDAGTGNDGRPFFVMELVKGLALTEYCDARRLSVNDRLDLFIQICSAVQHAHQKAVIHRDLKPTNVLVTEHDGKPIPKVIDFGLAKALGATNVLTDRTLHTAYGTVVGTPLYMAPEQVGINALDVDTRTDIYALGVILYELLTGTTPLEKAKFKEAAWEEMKRLIREEEPPRPSTRLSSDKTLPSLAASRQVDAAKLPGLVRGELDWIVMKALEKDRTRRYETANGLAKDVQRFLKGDAVEACPPTLGYRLRKMYRRYRAAVLVSGTIATVLLLATGVSLAFGILAKQSEHRAARSADDARASEEVAQRERDEANQARAALEVERQALREMNYARSIQVAHQSWLDGSADRTVKLLEDADPQYRGWEWDYLNRLCHAELFTLKQHPDSTGRSPTYAKYSLDGSRIVTSNGTFGGEEYGIVIVWDARTGEKIRSFTHGSRAASPDFHPNGSRVVVIHDVKKMPGVDDASEVIVWDAKTGERILSLKGHTRRVYSAAYSPDGSRIVTTSFDQTAIVWDAKTGLPLTTHKGKGVLGSTMFHPQDGSRILSRGLDDGIVYVWDARSGEILHELKDDVGPGSASFSPDGRMIITTSMGGPTRVWNAETHAKILTLNDGSRYVYHASLSPDSRRIVTSSGGGVVTIWDAKNGAELRTYKGHTSQVGAVSFNHDGSRILTGSWDGTAKVWDTTTSSEPPLLPMQELTWYMAFNPQNGSQMAIGTRHGSVMLWDVTSRTVTRTLFQDEAGAFLRAVKFSRDGKRLVTVRTKANQASREFTSEATVWDVKSGNSILLLKGGRKNGYFDASFSPDGEWIVTAIQGGMVRIWEIKTGDLVRTLEGHAGAPFSASFSPDGKRIVSTGNADDKTARIWDVATGKELVRFQGHGQPGEESPVWHAAFSPDGKRVVSAGNGKIIIWDPEMGAEVVRLKGVNLGDYAAFSPNGKRLITTSGSGVTIWDAMTGQELLTLKGSGVNRLEFSPDGSQIPVVTPEGVRLYDSRPFPRDQEEPNK